MVLEGELKQVVADLVAAIFVVFVPLFEGEAVRAVAGFGQDYEVGREREGVGEVSVPVADHIVEALLWRMRGIAAVFVQRECENAYLS